MSLNDTAPTDHAGMQAEAAAILADLVGFPTVSGLPNGNIVDYIAARLECFGATTLIDRHADGTRANVVATFGDGLSGGVVLCGHMDVVPADPAGWCADPFRLRRDGERLIGRGAVDMKGFLAMCLAAAPLIAAEAGRLKRPIHFIFTFDEEEGCFGAAQVGAFLAANGIAPAAAIVGEPTGMVPVSAHRALLELTTTVTGSSGHASNPTGKVSAVHAASLLMAEIVRRADALSQSPHAQTPFLPPYATINIGRVAGGEARNAIANICHFDWEVRPLPYEDGDAIFAGIESHAAALAQRLHARDREASIKTEVIARCLGLAPHANCRAADLVRRLWTDEAPGVVSFGTDAGYLQAAGIDTVVFGPGEFAAMHQPEEWITDGQIAAGLTFIARVVDDCCR
ncbi:acetylornithine deacetylase [Acuticoccus sp. MNP-M23]|uniref:acetylornithine deacetylase n=1 Tax=Acuticoccus sp. MNP-M23 TaxID=3072793 RepID=UPI0028162C0E|nr:acetylornithine deacetylase [Acuticoccus sp. MNP-M23]WMS43599.1 acetylornithine deacetylase [Acuticoccus sp. MNP-M23]